MRWNRVIGISAAAAAAIAAVLVASCANQGGTGAPAPLTQEQKVARGSKLVWAGGCVDCHTPGTFYGAPDTTRMLSGTELGWTGPWGTTYPRNLTPDSTGIVAWSEDQIVATIKTGHRPDGSALLPPMPWQAYSYGFSDEDLHNIAAYLKSLPPIHHVNPQRVPPGGQGTLPALVFPPPPAWDAQNLPPPPGAGSTTTP